MQNSIQTIVSIYGALLSTALAVIAIIKFWREKPSILVTAITVVIPSDEGEETHGVLVRARRGNDFLWEEVDIEIRIRNSGAQACQITDVFVETDRLVVQIRPSGMPLILEPNTSYAVRVQPEHFAPKKLATDQTLTEEIVEAAGVFDGLGKKHYISKIDLAKLLHMGTSKNWYFAADLRL
jgi:hypothetical protein